MAKMEMNRQEEYLNRIDRLKLMDDDFFSEALDGKIEAVEFILQVVLERDDLKVIETKAQVEYKSATKRSIRLDIKAVDRENERFNLEIQRAEEGSGSKRARFHGSMIDRDLLEKGWISMIFLNRMSYLLQKMISMDVENRCIISSEQSRKKNMCYLMMVCIFYM